MANAGASVLLAAQAAREKAVELATTGRDAPFAGAAPGEVIVADGRLSLAGTNLNLTYAELIGRNGLSSLVGDGDYDPVEEGTAPTPSSASRRSLPRRASTLISGSCG
jgi:hypothetical protein